MGKLGSGLVSSLFWGVAGRGEGEGGRREASHFTMEGNSGRQQLGTQASSTQSTTPREEPQTLSTATSWALKPTPASTPTPSPHHYTGSSGLERPETTSEPPALGKSPGPRSPASPPPAPQQSLGRRSRPAGAVRLPRAPAPARPARPRPGAAAAAAPQPFGRRLCTAGRKGGGCTIQPGITHGRAVTQSVQQPSRPPALPPSPDPSSPATPRGGISAAASEAGTRPVLTRPFTWLPPHTKSKNPGVSGLGDLPAASSPLYAAAGAGNEGSAAPGREQKRG